jgi:hypothetical protein
MKFPKIEIADVIKVFAVVTAMPRWVGALLAAEGFPIPAAWMSWWIPLSAAMSATMAIVEGLAFAFVFSAWRKEQNKSNSLLWLALASAALFVGVLAPYIAASVVHKPLATILENGIALALWSIAVGASTISIVASVGYAQKQTVARNKVSGETTVQNEQPKGPEYAITSNRERVLMIHQAQPEATHAEIAQLVGISRQQVGKYLKPIKPINGKVSP